jgi:hypothetical protein
MRECEIPNVRHTDLPSSNATIFPDPAHTLITPSSMAPRPFPSTLNIGTDIVLLSRLTRMLSKDPTRFLRRVLTPREHLAFKARFPRDFEHVLSRLREDGKHFELANIVDFIGGR